MSFSLQLNKLGNGLDASSDLLYEQELRALDLSALEPYNPDLQTPTIVTFENSQGGVGGGGYGYSNRSVQDAVFKKTIPFTFFTEFKRVLPPITKLQTIQLDTNAFSHFPIGLAEYLDAAPSFQTLWIRGNLLTLKNEFVLRPDPITTCYTIYLGHNCIQYESMSQSWMGYKCPSTRHRTCVVLNISTQLPAPMCGSTVAPRLGINTTNTTASRTSTPTTLELNFGGQIRRHHNNRCARRGRKHRCRWR